ncbi:hypothetical protein KTI07_04130 [Acinetobacter lwoffii]|uniref:hypothetical protein n=1 Tax=Acinetobacter lwoffii TaxID=28090 RepID=UPI0021CD381D|nr:hypothetical protein [Acinetobacter lwoffii]MCU4438712.1 hypothetical protein [Acinetobacter lwoffii]
MNVTYNEMEHPVLGNGQSMIEKLHEAHAKMEAIKVEFDDEPYAILVDQENFEKLLQETQHTKPDLKPNEVAFPILYGIPVILQDVYAYKVVTLKEYKAFYEGNVRKIKKMAVRESYKPIVLEPKL